MIEPKYLKEFEANSGISVAQLEATKLPHRLPEEYIEVLKQFNGGEGDIGEEYLVLHSAQELQEINDDIEIAQFDKDIFIIGSNGGGEFIALDFRGIKPMYILIPFIFEYDAIITLGESIQEMFKRIYSEGYFN